MTTTQDMDPELSLLLRIRERLSDPENWCQNRLGTERGPNCLVGAYVFEQQNAEYAPFRAWLRLTTLAGARSLDKFNNAVEHADILDLLDRAIAARTAELAEKETA